MRAGALNRRITIQQRDTGVDAAGQPLQTWSDFAKVWTFPVGKTGLLVLKEAGEVPLAVKQYSLRIRYREDINEGMRVVYRGYIFDIKQVRMDFSGREWADLICEQGGNNG